MAFFQISHHTDTVTVYGPTYNKLEFKPHRQRHFSHFQPLTASLSCRLCLSGALCTILHDIQLPSSPSAVGMQSHTHQFVVSSGLMKVQMQLSTFHSKTFPATDVFKKVQMKAHLLSRVFLAVDLRSVLQKGLYALTTEHDQSVTVRLDLGCGCLWSI